MSVLLHFPSAEKMNEIIEKIIDGYQPILEEVFEKLILIISNLEMTSQDNRWHEEGNVWIHTNMVLQTMYKIINSEAKHLTNIQKTIFTEANLPNWMKKRGIKRKYVTVE